MVEQMLQPICVDQKITVENLFFYFIIWFAESKLRNSGHLGGHQNPLPFEPCFWLFSETLPFSNKYTICIHS